MENITFLNSTLITGATATFDYVVGHINKKQIGIPVCTFTYSDPDIDLVTPPIDLIVNNASFYTDFVSPTGTSSVTAYNAAVSIMINTSAYGIPIYRVPNQTNIDQVLTFQFPTIVSSLTSTGQYLVAKINDSVYGIPLVNYSSLYPFTTSAQMSALPSPTTQVGLGEPVRDIGIDSSEIGGSTYLNNKIKTYQQLINRIQYQLGAPLVNLEVCQDTQIVDFIDQSIEWYTKYAGFTEEFLIFSSNFYTEPGMRLDQLFSITPTMATTMTNGTSGGWDYDLSDYRKVTGVFDVQQGESTGINSLFTLEQAMAQQTYFSYMLGNVGFDLVTWEILKGWLDLREKVLAQVIYTDFNTSTQLLRLIPPPRNNEHWFGVVGCWVEKPIKDLMKERWVYQYSLALTKIAIGNVRGKYGSATLLGGGTLNYNEFKTEGNTEKLKLEEELMLGYGEVVPARFYIGAIANLLVPVFALLGSGLFLTFFT